MAKRERHETSYYPEIMSFIEAQLVSNFRASCNRELHVYWKIGELSTKLKEIIEEHPIECACLSDFARTVPPLNLDIFAVITDGEHYELLILEVKLVNSAGLNEWSQLIGYCIVSNAKYGLLVNIDSGGSNRLNSLLQNEEHISKIERIYNGQVIEHLLGFMQWDSLTHNFEYSNLGQIWSLSALSDKLAEQFSKR